VRVYGTDLRFTKSRLDTNLIQYSEGADKNPGWRRL
jgi:hypothetical protein